MLCSSSVSIKSSGDTITCTSVSLCLASSKTATDQNCSTCLSFCSTLFSFWATSTCVEFRRFEVLRRRHAIDATRLHQRRRWVVFFSTLSAFGPRRGRSRGRRAKFGQRRRSAAAAGSTGPWHARHRLDAVAGSRTPLRWFRASRGAAAAAEDTQTPSHRAPAAATPSTRVVARRGGRGWFLSRF